jgi:CBS domain-containing protein
MNISKIMTRKVVSIDKNTTLSSAISIMSIKGIKELPVLSNKKYVGLLLYYDLMSKDAAKTTKIEGFVKKVPTLSPRDLIDKAIKTMQTNGVGAVPITDEDKKLVGIISDYDIIKLLINSRVFDSLKVEDVVIRRFPILRTDDNIGKAQKLAALNKIDGLPVIDNFGRTVGQVLLSDILKYTAAAYSNRKSGKKDLDPNKLSMLDKNIMEISRRELPQISLTLNLRRALEIMLSAKIKGAIVIDNDMHPVGVLSRLKILDMLGGKKVGDNIDVEVSGDCDYEFMLIARSEINKREQVFFSAGGIDEIKIHIKKVHDPTGKYQFNLNAFGKKRYDIKVEGMTREMLLMEAVDKLENAVEHQIHR